MTLKILYIDGDGPMGGASRSLFEAVSRLVGLGVSPYFLVSSGTASDFYRKVSNELVETRGMSKFDNTRYGYYRGVRWLIVLREIFHAPFMISALLRAKRKWGAVDVVHVNEFVYILPALLAKWLFRAPLVVHVRALARDQQDSRRVRMLNWVFNRYVDKVVAIDGNVRNTLAPDLPIEIINNSFNTVSSGEPAPEFVERLAALDKQSLKVGFVGNLHLSKGVLEIVEAAALMRKTGRKIDFVLVGGITIEDKGFKAWLLSKLGFAQNFGSEIKRLIHEGQLEDTLHLMGPTLDIKYVYDRLDVLLFPSHFDAPGRPVFEAGFSSVPSIVAAENPTPDTFVPNETGLAIPARNSRALADAIAYMYDYPQERERMGRNAHELAQQNFMPDTNAKKLLSVYKSVLVKHHD
ncbi:glycosyltransferase family 4 protein [Pseudomonas putida]|uniref:glycosyltransferase family 4 protein n=1 Tax=Pseudomonas TaxID=286 RepID=UPI002364433C|nr:glycosyltransferase family 4 protein [Pseudomonas putida]MDD2026176.1 glycosyltransferase family 4 protein [Pseudomonas putida]HDS1767343.1 glycosyltransferase family 4 protein [Pseudomonas putida]